ncbi:YafY family protein [Streptomyces sp. TRM76323]|uniref:YafY family protein n=1 Tax=Streptomyces tamarix TaxID=3078565 RepID=A0ABU3QTT5_9ACTN|nr:YafY family protein [Streptomyces tamarix]MDT9686191.1 YafY family protein [Streptomyces tamarix]
MLETSARLLRLLSLLQAHRDWSGAALAERLGVTPRTVRRDVDRLRELGYPVHATPGTGGGYQLGAGARLPPLLLDDEEAVAVAVGLRTAAGRGVEGIGETSLRALAKLDQVLPDRLRRRVSALTTFTVPAMRAPREGQQADAAVLTELAGACRDGERLRFAYRDHNGTTTHRTAEPYRLVCTERRWYLVAWDVDRGDWRTFRVDRITPTPPHGPRFTPRTPPAEDLAAYVARGVSTAAYAARAVIRLHASAQEAAQVVGVSDGVVEAESETTCLLHTGACGLDVLVVHVALMGLEFEVVEPSELVGHLSSVRDRLTRALDRSAARPGPPGRPAPDAGTSRAPGGAGRTPGTPTG